LERFAVEEGLPVSRDDSCVKIIAGDPDAQPTLLLATHLDTVPAGEGWRVDPYAGHIDNGALHARGAVDAKASVAAMACAVARLNRQGGPRRGRLVLLATYAEETRNTTMPNALERLGALPDAALIGEPTTLEPCIAQRGLVIARLVWTGEQLHAGWAASLPRRPESAITRAARDLLTLASLDFGRRHPLLGDVVATVTQLTAGVARNVTPPYCEAIVDVRTTPALTHEEIAARLRESLQAEVEILSDRLRPASTPANSRLLATIRAVRPNATPFASPTSSDWVFLREVDAVKLGPGDSRLSHTVDERIDLDEVEQAVDLYALIAKEYLS
jgi:acetylornithine deacetylase